MVFTASSHPGPKARIGPFQFADGWSRGNAATVWAASLSTIGLAAFMSFMQPYLLAQMLDVPTGQQGRLTGGLGALRELVAMLLGGFVGAWSDRLGRRPMYVAGLVIMGMGLAVVPLATSIPELVAFSLLFAVGVSIAPLMLSACVVDAIQEPCRGRWLASNNLLQAVGILLMSLVLAKTPLWYANLGASEQAAGRYAFWTAGAICLAVALVLWLGLPRTAPNRERARQAGVLPQMARALAYSRQNPRLALAFAAAFIGRGDFTVIGYFFSLWVTQVGIAEGLTAGQSLARAGMLFGIIQLAAVAWAFAMGMIMDRVNRVTGIALAFGLATVGYAVLGQVGDPFAPGFFGIALLVGAGESSVIVAAGALLGQEARVEHRGPVVGFYSALGACGILFATAVGGLLYDRIGPAAPFTMMAILNAALLVAALFLRRREASS